MRLVLVTDFQVGSRVSFPGCIRNVTVSKLDIGPPTAPYKMQDCYQDSPEAGVSFEHGGGYLNVNVGESACLDNLVANMSIM